jgi:hypothetical protein
MERPEALEHVAAQMEEEAAALEKQAQRWREVAAEVRARASAVATGEESITSERAGEWEARR